MPGKLAALVRAKYPGAYDDLDDAALERQVLAKYPEYADLAEPEPPTEAPRGPLTMTPEQRAQITAAWPPGQERPTPRSMSEIAGALPMLGGAAGALVAAPATGGLSVALPVAGAALGGAGGGLLKTLINAVSGGEVPSTAGGVLQEGAIEGGKQGLLEAGGRGASAVLKAVARPVYNAGLAASAALRRQFPTVNAAGLRTGAVTVGQGQRALEQSSAKAEQMIADAQAAGATPVSARELVRELRPVRETAQKRIALGIPDETPAIADRARRIHQQNRGGIPLIRAQELKREAQDLAETAYRTQERGGNVNAIDMQANEAVATGLRKGIEARVPAVAGQNRQTQELIGLKRALEQVQNRPHALRDMMSILSGITAGAGAGNVGVGAVGGLTTAALLNPTIQRALGIGLDRASQLPFANLIRAALMSQLGDQPEP